LWITARRVISRITDSVKCAVRSLLKRERDSCRGAEATEELDIYRFEGIIQELILRAKRSAGSASTDHYMRNMRLRKVQGKLKIEHSIIDGLRDVLETMLDSEERIRSIIPGVIKPVKDAKGKVEIRVTVPVVNGWKAIALAAGARQELFVSTDLDKPALEAVIARALLDNR
jgi:hypothetical protein